jgi:NADP-dependent 3-hydroxy acid dehydrogenase YdfG
MQDELAQRKVLVCGGASGIGRASAAHFAKAGARVLVADRLAPPEPMAADFHPVDVREPAQVDALFAAVQERLGAPDVLVSCAGVGVHERLTEGDPSKWAQVLEVNVLGALRLIRAFVPAMLERGGDVVVVSSVAARQAYPWGGAYAASKAALEMVAETLRLEAQPKIRVTTLAPGVVDTPFFDHMLAGNQSVKDIGFGCVTAEQIAELIAYAVSRPPNMALNHVVVRPRGQSF